MTVIRQEPDSLMEPNMQVENFTFQVRDGGEGLHLGRDTQQSKRNRWKLLLRRCLPGKEHKEMRTYTLPVSTGLSPMTVFPTA